MATKSKSNTSKRTTKKATPKKATPTKAPSNKTAAKPKSSGPETPVVDPCAAGHQWDTDDKGVEFCTVCKADRQVIEKPSKTKKERPPKADGNLSAIDAAAKVLAEADEPLNAKQMIEAMSAKGYWTSPGGKTPHATLYSAILREVQTKGSESRFVKTERGKFAAKR